MQVVTLKMTDVNHDERRWPEWSARCELRSDMCDFQFLGVFGELFMATYEAWVEDTAHAPLEEEEADAGPALVRPIATHWPPVTQLMPDTPINPVGEMAFDQVSPPSVLEMYSALDWPVPSTPPAAQVRVDVQETDEMDADPDGSDTVCHV